MLGLTDKNMSFDKNDSKSLLSSSSYIQTNNGYKKLRHLDNYKDLNIEEKFFITSENIGKLILNKRLKLLKKYKKCFFTIDIFPDPILSIVFQITDDAFNQERRNAIFNREYTIFAVNSIEDNKKNFISISSFAT